MILCDISSKRKIDKIPIQCDQCRDKFERELRGVLGQRNKRNGKDLCSSCLRLKTNRHKEQLLKNIYICEICGDKFERTQNNYIKNKQRNKKVICTSCANKEASKYRPQCQKEYWVDEEIKKKHGNSVRNSKKYQESRKNIDISGEKNGMYGKKHSKETSQKMSKSRTGKVQSQETINKRRETCRIKREEKMKNGEFNLNKALKHFVNSELKWTGKIFERDNKKCIKCGDIEKLDAHHIKSFNSIIKELLEGTDFSTNFEKYNYLKEQKEIRDENLENGVLLCRKCHRKVHGMKWGSHNI